MPFYDIYSEDVRCGRGASKSGEETKTAEVFAGDEVGFVVGRSAMEPLEPHLIYHNGPGQVYLSQSTAADVREYEGDGNWFKISYHGPTNDSWWSTRDQTGMNFTIPDSTPPGQYLLRVEHLYVRYPIGTTQFYIACAQINVRPPRNGTVGAKTPSPEYMVRFPGGLAVPEYMYEWPNTRLTEYKPPGPALWTG
ncbi:glycosyl hydrolase family 61-domain-containing protein [Cercophora newfieldiana]|uniref:lytic cellulose monooxygenase (C4-dehydrogenating) n=1 Tax=Cercophora newfieldiana TaxID=92897 RepID=A0AA39XQN4_9PEZI|nr:glycosyl hydrolase family 61-domain-containing protein [Cercophora newfieldiana]